MSKKLMWLVLAVVTIHEVEAALGVRPFFCRAPYTFVRRDLSGVRTFFKPSPVEKLYQVF